MQRPSGNTQRPVTGRNRRKLIALLLDKITDQMLILFI